MESTALLTDQYELTMLRAALRAGTAQRQCVFEAFARRLPDGRRYGVVSGTGRLLEAIEAFRFGADDLAFLLDARIIDPDLRDWLADYRFAGDVDGYRTISWMPGTTTSTDTPRASCISRARRC